MSLVCTIDETGIRAPSFQEVYDTLRAAYRGIYGQDVYLEPDSQDGQWVAILATAVHDTNSMAVAAYNAYSPLTAQGVGLSRVVKINGIRRNIPTFSTVDLLVVGEVGTIVTGGIASDDAGNRWLLPDFTIPIEGETTVTATAAVQGSVLAPSNTVTSITTPTRGWQTVTNPAAAISGEAVETDVELRARQAISTALPSNTVLEGILGSVAAILGVTRFRGYENDRNVPDTNGIPGHAIALVVEGGDAHEIALSIARKKTPGAGTYGSTVEIIEDAYGIPHDIRFFRPTDVPIAWYISLKAYRGYTADVETQIAQALSGYANALGIGTNLQITKAFTPANLSGAVSNLFEITSLVATRDGEAPGVSADIPIAFNEAAFCVPESVHFTVTPA